jgi:hypothetical protein
MSLAAQVIDLQKDYMLGAVAEPAGGSGPPDSREVHRGRPRCVIDDG